MDSRGLGLCTNSKSMEGTFEGGGGGIRLFEFQKSVVGCTTIFIVFSMTNN
jgi:hypothetical protein